MRGVIMRVMNAVLVRAYNAWIDHCDGGLGIGIGLQRMIATVRSAAIGAYARRDVLAPHTPQCGPHPTPHTVCIASYIWCHFT